MFDKTADKAMRSLDKKSIGCCSRRYTWICWTLVLLVSALGVAVLVTALYEVVRMTTKEKIPDSGTVGVTEPLSTYGFGAEKWLLVVDHTEIGGVENIDLKDKKHATMQVWKAGEELGTPYDIGIEIKGRRDRTKLNYGVELWKTDGEDATGATKYAGDDALLPMFEGQGSDAFNEEDYVLRGGFMEPTLTRDAFAAKSGGSDHVRYPTELVELVFCRGAGANSLCTYEGVYLFMYDIGRNSVKETAGEWKDLDSKKLKCSKLADTEKYPFLTNASDAIRGEVGLIFEYTTQTHKALERCGALTQEQHIKMEYPKCDFYDDIKTDCPEHAKAYADAADPFRALPDSRTVSALVNIDSFVRHFITEAILMSDDFPFASQFFHVPPAATLGADRQLHAGPAYDFDGIWWRISHTMDGSRDSLEFTDRSYYDAEPMALWVALGRYAPFLKALKKDGPGLLDARKMLFDKIFEDRVVQEAAGYWKANNERWKPYGHAYISGVERASYWLFRREVITKDTMAEELTFARQWVTNRVDTIGALLPRVSKIGVNDKYSTFNQALARLTPLIVILSLFVLGLVVLVVGVCVRAAVLEHPTVHEYDYRGVPTVSVAKPLLDDALAQPASSLPNIFLRP